MGLARSLWARLGVGVAGKLEKAVKRYTKECSRLTRSGFATDELSFYPTINELLTVFGSSASPPRTTIPNPAAREGDFPDVAIYEEQSQALVLPVEVKPSSYSKHDLLKLDQSTRYARSFGGGHVLLTNLCQYVWAELEDDGSLVERDCVSLVADPAEYEKTTPGISADAADKLGALLEGACALRSSIGDAELVAQLLAYHARLMVEAINDAGDPRSLLEPVATSLHDGLGMDLEEEFFVSTIVQTLVYGLFSA